MRWTFCSIALLAIAGLVGCGPKPMVNPTPDNTGGPGPVTPAPSPAPGPTDPTPGPIDPAPAPIEPAPAPGPADPAPAPGPNDPLPNPDNTGVNVRDQDPNAKTPEAQENNETALNITATIRKRIADAPGMSVNARNVKIVTANGTVTLRGPVATAEEKSQIETFAKEAAGDFKVENFLEVP